MSAGLVVTGEPERLHFEAGSELSAMYLLSPFVWQQGGAWRVAVRAVPCSNNPREKIARVHLGDSDDGVRFRLNDVAALAPGPGADDVDGCEDPTVVADGSGSLVFYSGWDESRKAGQLLHATAEVGRRRSESVVVSYRNPARSIMPRRPPSFESRTTRGGCCSNTPAMVIRRSGSLRLRHGVVRGHLLQIRSFRVMRCGTMRTSAPAAT